MSKIFETQFEKGSLIDAIENRILTPTGTVTLKRTDKGTAALFDGGVSSSEARLESDFQITTIPFTVIVNFKFVKGSSVGYIVSQTLQNNPGRFIIDIQSDDKLEYFLGGDSFKTDTLVNNKWYQAIFTRDGDGVCRFYLDNKYLGTYTNNNAIPLSNLFQIGGSSVVVNRVMFGYINKVIVYDGAISTVQIEKHYQEFLQSQITEKPVRGFELVKPTDLSSKVRDKITLMSNPTKLITGRFTATGDVTIDSETQFTKTASGVVTLSGYWNINLGKPTYLYFKFSQNNGNPLTIRTSSLTIKFNGSNTINLSEGVLHKVEITNITNGQNIVIDPATFTGTYNIETFFVTSEEGLVAAYNMKPNGNTLVDISGNGNNGTITGCVVQEKEGLVFDGTTGYVNFANTKLATSDFTVITRVKLNDYPASSKNIISTTTLDNGRFLGIYNKSIGLYNGSGWISGVTELTPKQEYTLAYVCDGSVINLYVDGVLDITGSKGPYNGLSLETIGKWTSDFSRNISGVIKDIRFCNRALSVQEIKDYHNSFIKPVLLIDFSDEAVGNTI